MEHLEFGLVRKSLRERLLHIAPHLVRPLPYSPHEPEASVTRRHIVRDHGAYGGPDGLISIVGGKLTTYRELAEQASTLYCASWVVPQPARAQRTSHSLARERASPGQVSRVRGRHL